MGPCIHPMLCILVFTVTSTSVEISTASIRIHDADTSMRSTRHSRMNDYSQQLIRRRTGCTPHAADNLSASNQCTSNIFTNSVNQFFQRGLIQLNLTLLNCLRCKSGHGRAKSVLKMIWCGLKRCRTLSQNSDDTSHWRNT